MLLHNIDGEEKRVNGFSLFEDRIKPEWEDIICAQGGEFRWDFKAPISIVQKIWEKLVFTVVTGEFAEFDKICGVRLLDKSMTGKENFFRVEVWTKFSNEGDKEAQEIKKYVETEIVKFFITEEGKDGKETYVHQSKFTLHAK